VNDFGARPHGELDLEALARGDRVAAGVLVELCRTDRALVFEPSVLAALKALSNDRARARDWVALQAQLRSVRVDVGALKRKLKEADAADSEAAEDADDSPADQESDAQANRLLRIADQCEYFVDDFGTPFMSLEHSLPGGSSRLETIRIVTKRARLFFVNQYTLAFGKPPSDTALRGVLEALAARATFGDEVHPVFIRRARHNGKIYIDRGTEDGSAYEVDGIDWRIVARPPVRFIRVAGMLPLPEAVHVDPKEGLLKLKEVTRFQAERDGVLVVGFMLDALGGEGPYSVLVISGEAGSAKSTLAKLIGFLVDPRIHFLLTAPKSKRDVFINASNRAAVAFNNLSTLEPAISDAICTATEGGVDSQRALYTDGDESSICAKAPFILVSVGSVVTRGDLADRSLKTELAAIPPSERITEPDFWVKFQQAAPTILGALLGGLSQGLRRYDDLGRDDLPRLATFAKFVTACETAFWPKGTFAKALAESAATAGADVLSDDPVAETFEEFMNDRQEWKGTGTVLLRELEAIVRKPERIAEMAHALVKSRVGKSTNPHDVKELAEATADLKEARERVHTILDGKWPKAANALSRRLRELGPQLRGAGIHILWPNSHKDGRVLTVTNMFFDLGKEETRETSSSSSYRPPPPNDGGSDRNNSSVLDDNAQPADELWSCGERSAERAPWDRPPSFDPDFMPDESAFPSDGPVGSTKSNGASAPEDSVSSGLREEGEGFERRFRDMTPAEILATAAARGFRVGLNRTGDGLKLWPGDDPPADLVDLIRGAKRGIVALLQAERGRINRWIACRLIDWPPSSCLHCRNPIVPGQRWTVVSNGEVAARFHQDCHDKWLAQQEKAALKALGLER
jgi:hypothetical protein